jgi:hypothetical protein
LDQHQIGITELGEAPGSTLGVALGPALETSLGARLGAALGSRLRRMEMGGALGDKKKLVPNWASYSASYSGSYSVTHSALN